MFPIPKAPRRMSLATNNHFKYFSVFTLINRKILFQLKIKHQKGDYVHSFVLILKFSGLRTNVKLKSHTIKERDRRTELPDTILPLEHELHL